MAATRRQFLTIASLTAAAGLGATACRGNSSGSSDGTLQFTWWGNEVRNKNTTDAIAAYTAANPAVKITPQPGEWGSYWDKLATQTAGNNAPDVIQMDMAYINEYGSRGALLNLADHGLDTSKFAPGTADSGIIDGVNYGVNAGINTPTILLNPKAFAAAGVPVPDDTTWTWDTLRATAAAFTAKTSGKVIGVSAFLSNDALFSAWLRQQGKQLFAGKTIGFDVPEATAWLEMMQAYAKDKAIPSPSQITEDAAKSLDQQDFATGKTAMSMFWSNQVQAVNGASGEAMRILRFPSIAGKATERKAWYKASMLWSASARTKDPEGAVKLINWWVNSPECADICLAERGIPANTENLTRITPKLSEAQQGVAKFINDIKPELADTPIAPPPGGGKLGEVMQRSAIDMLFGKLSAADAAKKFVDEIKSDLQG